MEPNAFNITPQIHEELKKMFLEKRDIANLPKGMIHEEAGMFTELKEVFVEVQGDGIIAQIQKENKAEYTLTEKDVKDAMQKLMEEGSFRKRQNEFIAYTGRNGALNFQRAMDPNHDYTVRKLLDPNGEQYNMSLHDRLIFIGYAVDYHFDYYEEDLENGKVLTPKEIVAKYRDEATEKNKKDETSSYPTFGEINAGSSYHI